MASLAVFLDGNFVGQIAFEGSTDRYSLSYDASWLNGGYIISPHLPSVDCRSDSVKRFLANLLPEGQWLEELSLNTQISKSNIFGLVAAIGSETTGALTFRMEGDSPGPGSTAFRAISREELTERILHRQQHSIAIWDGKPRLSVAGVQEKLPILFMRDGGMGFGEGDFASTHILKFGKAPEMHLVVNEFLCMKLAEIIKLPVAEVSLVRLGEPVLVVKRFDRQWSGENRVSRLHLIDGCQLLDLPPSYKYERPFGKGGSAGVIRDGASLPKLFSACRLCRIPAVAKRDLLNWALFQLIIGNGDAHAKNISFFVSKKGIEVAPAYDLLSLDLYAGRYDRDFAMAVGDTFDPEALTPWELAEMCFEIDLSQRLVGQTLSYMCDRVLSALDKIDALFEGFSEAEEQFTARLIATLKGNAKKLKAMGKEVAKVRL